MFKVALKKGAFQSAAAKKHNSPVPQLQQRHAAQRSRKGVNAKMNSVCTSFPKITLRKFQKKQCSL